METYYTEENSIISDEELYDINQDLCLFGVKLIYSDDALLFSSEK